MEYRKLGKWGIKVSEVGLGSWLTYGETIAEEDTSYQVHFAFERGINFFDCANVYAHGQAERMYGKALKDIKRDSVVLATKVFFPMDEGANDRGLSRKHIFEQCHHSLERLNTDYIDLYQCHRPDPNVPIYETVRAMDDLIKQGKILYWGVSEWSADQIEEAVHTAYSLNAMPPVSNQPQYNMLWRRIEDDVIGRCEELGVGQVVFSPLAQGVLTGKYKPGQPYPKDSRAADDKQNFFLIGRDTMSDETLALVQRLLPIAEGAGLSMAQLALAWCLRKSNVASVIIGATKVEQIEDNCKAVGTNLGDDVWKKVDDVLAAAVK
ncbi:MAG TPA: aldo/keto reductase family protein [Planktothrix sp.]|jgi:voltage-dependent potassium channel beta subunit